MFTLQIENKNLNKSPTNNMKLEQVIAKAVDQNEIESKYLWYCPASKNSKTIYRINLSAHLTDLSMELLDLSYVKHIQALPDNNIFGIKIVYSQSLFISDSSFNTKSLKLSTEYDLFHIDSIDIASCFYDDSIFIFECGIDYYRNFVYEGDGDFNWFKRYSTSQNKWTSLAAPPFYYFSSCVGYQQKILISVGGSGIWVYDIILDSYSQFCTDIFKENSSKILIKNDWKVYMINQSRPYWIYSNDGNLSNWTLIYENKNNNLRMNCYLKYFYYAYYEGSIYYLSDSSLFKFDLKKFKIKKLKIFKKLDKA